LRQATTKNSIITGLYDNPARKKKSYVCLSVSPMGYPNAWYWQVSKTDVGRITVAANLVASLIPSSYWRTSSSWAGNSGNFLSEH
jgi:hypothetical protein